jgi:hypothetical protein
VAEPTFIEVAPTNWKSGKGIGVDAAIMLQAIMNTFPQPVERPAGAAHAGDRRMQIAALSHGLQRRVYFFVGPVAGSPIKTKVSELSVAILRTYMPLMLQVIEGTDDGFVQIIIVFQRRCSNNFDLQLAGFQRRLGNPVRTENSHYVAVSEYQL